MEQEVLGRITTASQGLGILEPFDGRGSLKKNPRGKKWKPRDVDALKGMVWHQELGWGSVEAVAKYHTGKNSHFPIGACRTKAVERFHLTGMTSN